LRKNKKLCQWVRSVFITGKSLAVRLAGLNDSKNIFKCTKKMFVQFKEQRNEKEEEEK
jgi:hypothetical protein